MVGTAIITGASGLVGGSQVKMSGPVGTSHLKTTQARGQAPSVGRPLIGSFQATFAKSLSGPAAILNKQ